MAPSALPRSASRLGWLALLSPTFVACAGHEAHAPAPAAPPTKVAVAIASNEPVGVTYRASGTVRGRNTAVLAAKTTGYVREVTVRSGDTVTAGQVLASLEANDTKASVARARAALAHAVEARTEAESSVEAARAAANVARTSHDRMTKLLADRAVSQSQYDEDEAHFLATHAQEQMAEARARGVSSSIEEARAALAEAEATLGYSKIVAPFTGRVLERHVDAGALASPGMPLFVIADEGSLRVEAAVEESRSASVAIGDDVDVDVAGTAAPMVGKVCEIVPTVDVTSRAFLVKIDLPASATSLRPGTFARVAFHVGKKPALVVPRTALTSFGALDRVFVVEDGSAHLRMVTRGEDQGGYTTILSGLSANERIVAAPGADLRDGSPVEVVK